MLFTFQTQTEDHILSAMTSGIRNNWMQAIRKCMEMSGVAVGDVTDEPDASHTQSPRFSTRSQSADSKAPPTPEQRNASPRGADNTAQLNGAYASPTKNSNSELSPWRRSHSSGATPRQASHTDSPGATARQTSHTEPKSGDDSNGHTPLFDVSYSTRKDSWGSNKSDSRRRLRLDSPSRLSDRSDSSDQTPLSPGGRRFSSCTWPYVPPSATTSDRSGTSSPVTDTPPNGKGRSKSVDHGRPSDVSAYLSEEEPNKPKELSQQEEDELDNVQRNIRRIHRKSIQEFTHKPQHFEKFEMGTVFSKKTEEKNGSSPSIDKNERSASSDTRFEFGTVFNKKEEKLPRSTSVPNEKPRQSAAYAAQRDSDILSSPRSDIKSSPRRSRTQSPRTRRIVDEQPKSPVTPRAPSAKVKEKTRAKSPRAKSPPPSFDMGDDFLNDMILTPKRRGSAPFAGDTPKDDIIERKWKEVGTHYNNNFALIIVIFSVCITFEIIYLYMSILLLSLLE